MNRHTPKNREEAFAHQFEDDVKQLLGFSQLIDEHGNNKKSFKETLEKLKIHIKSYEEMEAKVNTNIFNSLSQHSHMC